MRDAIKHKLAEIAESILHKVRIEGTIESNGLYNGDAGIVLFLFYYAKYTGNPAYTDIAEEYLEKILDHLGQATTTHTFCGGLSGILYLLEFLREKEFIDVDISEVEEDLEEYLIANMRRDLLTENYDFMHGAIGVGLYFLKKGTREDIVLELIDYLYKTADKDKISDGLKWKSIINKEKRTNGYNISLSHGMSSIVVFLSRVIKKRIVDSRLQSMLEKTIRYIQSQRFDFKIHGSHFPSISLDSSFISGVFMSRLGWCYGDLSVAMPLYYAGSIVNNETYRKEALDVLISSLERVDVKQTAIWDAGICHGSIGLVMIYRRIYMETKDKRFLDNINHWLNKTLLFSHFEGGLAGYKLQMKENRKLDYSLLTGIAGIGLVFISYLTNEEQEWDEMFLLS